MTSETGTVQPSLKYQAKLAVAVVIVHIPFAISIYAGGFLYGKIVEDSPYHTWEEPGFALGIGLGIFTCIWMAWVANKIAMSRRGKRIVTVDMEMVQDER